jgi:chemotaxis family two-component system sensor kinase Cph1
MNAVIAEVLTTLRETIEENKADVTVDPLPTVAADESQMMQVMQNLIGNALKFHGPDRPIIRISSSPGEREWTISVKDNGIGLDMADAEKIFLMFQRLNNRDEYPGTGIGLAVAKKIVERHAGRIWVESKLGKGATFFFTIPTAETRNGKRDYSVSYPRS